LVNKKNMYISKTTIWKIKTAEVRIKSSAEGIMPYGQKKNNFLNLKQQL